jgi:hypothetical protein
MHLAMTTHSVRCCAAAAPFGGAPANGRNFAHAERAALNDGEAGLIPEPSGIWMPWPPEGSGKLGTPWVRIHPANAIPDAGDEPLGFVLEEAPQAATTSPQAIMTGAMARLALIHGRLYLRGGNSKVTRDSVGQ